MYHPKFWPAALLFVALTSRIASSQEIPPSPPAAIISSASAAFAEYTNGTTYDTIIHSSDRPWDSTMMGGTPENPFVIKMNFNTSPGGEACCSRNSYPSRIVTRLVLTSDFAAIGEIVRQWSYPTSDQCFGITIYLVRLENVAVAGHEPLANGQWIYIVRAGGSFQYQGKYFQAVEGNFPSLQQQGHYLFFGKKIAENLYKVNAEQTLNVDGSSITDITPNHKNAEHFQRLGTDAILNEAREVWGSSIEGGTRK